MQKNQPPSASSSPVPATPISFAKAISLVAEHSAAILAASSSKTSIRPLSLALDRVLAAPLVAGRDQPPFPRVTRDGFAVRAQDLTRGVPLRIVGQLRAGERWSSNQPPLAAGEAIEIMTGAPLPPGADAVLMVEHAWIFSGSELAGRAPIAGRAPNDGHPSDVLESTFLLPHSGRTLAPGENVVPQGSEACQGDLLLQPGTRLHPDQIALAAFCGFCSVPVYAPPKVAILATGDELVAPSVHWPANEAGIQEDNPAIHAHQIYDSNSSSLAALVRRFGAIPVTQGAAPDRADALASSIRQGLKAAPLLLITGGVSMGKFDLVEDVLATMGAEFFFTGVAMQPGKPVVFGRVPAGKGRAPRYFFGLPGNPVSAMVTFRLFVQPLLAALAGQRDWQTNFALATLTSDLPLKRGLTRFLPACLDTSQPLPTVTPVPSQGSGDLAANARTNCYVVVPDDCDLLAADQPVRVLLR